MHMLKDERLAQHQPTQYPTSEELQMAGINFKAFDLGEKEGKKRKEVDPIIDQSIAHTPTARFPSPPSSGGHEIARRVWRDYFSR